jgi:hypothetical protein
MLCWGTVILFLSIPLLVLIVRIVSDSFQPPHWAASWSESLQEAKFIVPYFQSLTALVFGLAGLNTWDRRINGTQQSEKQPKKEPVNH